MAGAATVDDFIAQLTAGDKRTRHGTIESFFTKLADPATPDHEKAARVIALLKRVYTNEIYDAENLELEGDLEVIILKKLTICVEKAQINLAVSRYVQSIFTELAALNQAVEDNGLARDRVDSEAANLLPKIQTAITRRDSSASSATGAGTASSPAVNTTLPMAAAAGVITSSGSLTRRGSDVTPGTARCDSEADPTNGTPAHRDAPTNG